MEEKMISVIIPVYHSEKTIEECVKSIKGNNVEIILSIDGENDPTEEICKNLAKSDNRIKILEQENQGAFIARKSGIEKASGKYIMFLDSDDRYVDETINEMERLIEKYQEPDLIRFRYKKVPDGYEQYVYFEEAEKQILKQDFQKFVYPIFLNTYQLNAVWSNCVKREIFDKIHFAEKISHYGEDLVLNLEIFSNIQNAVFTNRILYNYVTNPESQTQTKNLQKLKRNLENATQVYSSLYTYLKKWGMDTEEYREIVRKRVEKEENVIKEIIQLNGKY